MGTIAPKRMTSRSVLKQNSKCNFLHSYFHVHLNQRYHLWVTFPSGHWEMSGDICGCHDWGCSWRRVGGPRVLLRTPQSELDPTWEMRDPAESEGLVTGSQHHHCISDKVQHTVLTIQVSLP